MNAPSTHFTILLGGDVVPTDRLARQIAGSRVIAADSGMRHASILNLRPELWTGDFDSVDDRLDAAFPDVEREVFPAAKDLTDGEIAVEAALARGAKSLTLVGAFGGPRADHAFLHLALAIRLSESGIDMRLTSGTEEGIPLRFGKQGFDLPSGSLFSVLAMTDLDGLTLVGARWPLTERDVPFGSSLTLSNEVVGDLAVSLRSGRAILIAHPLGAT
ncbi:thiamine diphosphokinase [Aliihoeflea aestuarii]|jgi:thiamine pyrophosphokinase|uniref:thiamine diphosphokinase n=1 Tax=Aliihoeflea aestuarii TaxID=453840 RepID=UPI002092BE5A|nr:thiamine diphosphokinase [Aliihoeflea aestuarii]MCO6391205.1 thiamine diphosphokinase [Aliihoeflea aestuarii]